MEGSVKKQVGEQTKDSWSKIDASTDKDFCINQIEVDNKLIHFNLDFGAQINILP